MTGVRMPPEERQAIEAWGAEQSPKVTFSKALRHLAQRGLAAANVDAQAQANRTAAPKRRKEK
jgi:hypothetical protein